MKKAHSAVRARRQLDQRFKGFPPVAVLTPPARGWIKALRTALGMSYRQLAERLGQHPATITGLERSEARGTIQLSTLRRLGEAMNCTLVYALVPNDALEAIVQRRARQVARKRLNAVSHTMRLEQQGVSADALESQLDIFAGDISPRQLWDD